ncbi:hypothetical protein GUJ93_ZPchr0007g3096 [Zizania palustris]|uniref:Uncharacterized protein n=1 Tax=Zizania palustris TaxID=103762 RepID=A0A8J5W570_ZIZPA|nr:hypothetical protein GUJ93_ZPchr0007g3096 [Zizania palustris]
MGRIGYGYSTPTSKAPKSCGFLVDDDEDMDEAFFREVDAICVEHERSSAGRIRRPAKRRNRSPPDRREMEDADEEEISVLSFGDGDAAKGQEPWEMELETEENEGCIPKKYYEYLHSLNDRQREAACNDAAIPLMIVAGPGSGKLTAVTLS